MVILGWSVNKICTGLSLLLSINWITLSGIIYEYSKIPSRILVLVKFIILSIDVSLINNDKHLHIVFFSIGFEIL